MLLFCAVLQRFVNFERIFLYEPCKCNRALLNRITKADSSFSISGILIAVILCPALCIVNVVNKANVWQKYQIHHEPTSVCSSLVKSVSFFYVSFLQVIIGGSCLKYHFCCDKTCLLSQKYACCDKSFVTNKKYVCCDKTFVMTSILLL